MATLAPPPPARRAGMGDDDRLRQLRLRLMQATATIVTTSPVMVQEFQRNIFLELSEKFPKLIRNIFSIYHQRLRSANDKALKDAREREARLEEMVNERTAELNQALVHDPEFSNWLIGRTPSRRWGELDDLVGAAIFLASDASRFVNGHILYVDGGVTATL